MDKLNVSDVTSTWRYSVNDNILNFRYEEHSSGVQSVTSLEWSDNIS